MRSLAVVVLLALTVPACGGSPGDDVEPTRDTEDAVDVRKQVYDLTAADLERFPVWEFALDEEGEEGQDEATVKPRSDLSSGVEADPDEGLLVVRAELEAADGTTFAGFVSPVPGGDLGAVQPSVVTPDGQVSFWFGMVEPDPQELESSYRRLGKEPAELFPITYRTAIPVDGEAMEGRIPGFLYLDESGETQVISRRGT